MCYMGAKMRSKNMANVVTTHNTKEQIIKNYSDLIFHRIKSASFDFTLCLRYEMINILKISKKDTQLKL